MQLKITSEVIESRGPAPFYFVRVPDEDAVRIRDVASMVTMTLSIAV